MEAVTEPARRIMTQPTPDPETTPSPPRFRQLLPWALSTSLILYLCFFPVAWGWLAWVALVPLLVLVRTSAKGKHVFFASWICGLCFYFPVLQWMRVADPRMYFTWFLLAIYISLYFPVGILLLRALDRRRVPLVLALPVVWTALDLLRAHLMGGFPWYFLGHSQHDFLAIIQFSDVAGAYGITFLIAAVNVVVFEWLWRTFRPECGVRRPALVFQSALVLLLFAGYLGYGSLRMAQADFQPGPKLALIQGNVPQQIKIDKRSNDPAAREAAQKRIEADYNQLGKLAAEQRPDLVVYPETSFMEDWDEIHTDQIARLNKRGWEMLRDARQLAEHQARAHEFGGHRPHVMLGLNANDWYPDQPRPQDLKRYNSALLIGPDGKKAGRYDKIHRVPFGEYVPLRDIIPFMDSFAPYDYDYSIWPGEQQARLPLGSHRFGVVICYEDTDTTLAREYVNPAKGPKADFLVNISNDGWFDGTAEHEQHLAICRFRAIEARRAVARSVNMGISAMIDGNGRVLAPQQRESEGLHVWEVSDGATELPIRQWGQYKKVAGVLVASIPIDGRESLYARWGDWLPWMCWGLLLVLLVCRRPVRV